MAGFGLAAARAAVRLERAVPIWFGFGAILGPIALLLLDAAPPGRCHSCSTPTRGWLTICGWCGEQVSATHPGAAAVAARPARSTTPPSLSGSRDLVRGRDQASPLRQIQPTLSVATTPAPAPGTREMEVQPPRTPQVEPPPAVRVTPQVQPQRTPEVEQPQRTPEVERWRVPNSAASIEGATARPADPTAGVEPAPVETRMLTTAVYVTGSTSLESGRRYLITIHGPRLQILGPVETDPSAVALDRAVAEMDATATDGRLVISGPGGRSGTVLIFMSVAGTTPDLVATAIVDAARTAVRA